MKRAKYSEVLTCPYCGFQAPEGDGRMPEQVDIISFRTTKKGTTVYTCGNCNEEFLE